MIKVNYSNNTQVNFINFDEIKNNDDVIEIDSNNNELRSLPDNMDFPNLEYFDCSNNELRFLPCKMYFPKLEYFDHHKLQDLLEEFIMMVCNANNRKR